jgi:hypothetical protein
MRRLEGVWRLARELVEPLLKAGVILSDDKVVEGDFFVAGAAVFPVFCKVAGGFEVVVGFHKFDCICGLEAE